MTQAAPHDRGVHFRQDTTSRHTRKSVTVKIKAADDSMTHGECSPPHPHVCETEKWNIYNIGNHLGIVVHVDATMEI